MTPAEHKFCLLKNRFKKAGEYERTKYHTDTPEKQEIAGEAILKLVNRMGEIWNEMTEEEKQRHMDVFEF